MSALTLRCVKCGRFLSAGAALTVTQNVFRGDHRPPYARRLPGFYDARCAIRVPKEVDR